VLPVNAPDLREGGRRSEGPRSYRGLSQTILRWTRNQEANALARMADSLEGDAVIVAIARFLARAQTRAPSAGLSEDRVNPHANSGS
jgi:hypothetical protein